MDKIGIIGKGQLGNAFNKFKEFEFISDTSINQYKYLINCTPGNALQNINKKINVHQKVINCCKGLFKNKTASQYFKNCYSIGGFYLYSKFNLKQYIIMPKNTPLKIKKILQQYFNIEYVSNSKQIEMCGVAKNISLIGNFMLTRQQLKQIFKITEQKVITYYYRDVILSKRCKSRNAKAFIMKKNCKSLLYIEQNLGLIEGIESLNNIKSKSYIIEELRKKWQ